MDTDELAERIALERPRAMTPMMFEYELIERARAERSTSCCPRATDERVLRAAEILLRRGVVELTLLGPERGARPRSRLGARPAGRDFVDPHDVGAAGALRGRTTPSCASTRA